ncbi:MAG: glycosyltransferase family 4 protein [Armatimonadota bacterium]
MMRIVHMTSVHAPYDVRIFHKECKTLAAAGHDVTYIVSGPCDEQRDGVKFLSVPLPSNRKERMLKTTREVYRAAMKLDADVYHFHDSELIPTGWLLKARGKRVIYDVHEELASDILYKDWVPAWVRPGLALGATVVQHISSWVFDGIIASRPALAESFSKRKTTLVNNFPILGELVKAECVPFRDRPGIAAYVGGLTAERGIPEIIEALGKLPDDIDFEVHIAGEFYPAALEERVRSMPGWKRVRMLGWQSREQVADLLNRARFGLIMFLPIANHVRSFPTKMFEYMSAGLPILASDMDLWREIVEKPGFGKVVNPKDTDALANMFRWMLEHESECEEMGRCGCEAVQREYNWDVDAKKLLALYDKLGAKKR